MTDSIILTLPLPPTLSALFNNSARGRIKSKRYLAWEKKAAPLFRNVGGFPDAISVHIRIPHERTSDCDNRPKAILDSLVKHGVIRDDRYVDYLTIEKHPDQPKKTCSVQVWSLTKRKAA